MYRPRRYAIGTWRERERIWLSDKGFFPRAKLPVRENCGIIRSHQHPRGAQSLHFGPAVRCSAARTSRRSRCSRRSALFGPRSGRERGMPRSGRFSQGRGNSFKRSPQRRSGRSEADAGRRDNHVVKLGPPAVIIARTLGLAFAQLLKLPNLLGLGWVLDRPPAPLRLLLACRSPQASMKAQPSALRPVPVVLLFSLCLTRGDTVEPEGPGHRRSSLLRSPSISCESLVNPFHESRTSLIPSAQRRAPPLVGHNRVHAPSRGPP